MEQTDYLSIGGGIISVKPISTGAYEDFGLCDNFEVGFDIVQQFHDRYYTDSAGRYIRLPSTNGVLRSLSYTGGFTCDSVTRLHLQKIWWLGSDSSLGTSLSDLVDFKAIVRSLKFTPDTYLGPGVHVEFPAVEITVSSKFPLLRDGWKSLTFSFRALFDGTTNTYPKIRIEE